jgi:hypothetical protein
MKHGLMMAVVSSSEISVYFYGPTRRSIPEGCLHRLSVFVTQLLSVSSVAVTYTSTSLTYMFLTRQQA